MAQQPSSRSSLRAMWWKAVISALLSASEATATLIAVGSRTGGLYFCFTTPAMSTMQSTQIINGKMSSSSSVDYSFTYRADRAGTVEVPKVSVSCRGRTPKFASGIFPDSSSRQAFAGRGAGTAQSACRRAVVADSRQGVARMTFSCVCSSPKQRVRAGTRGSHYQGIYEVRHIVVYGHHAAGFEGFLTEELPVSLESSMEHYNGQNYHTAVLKRLLLYPQKAGKLSVNFG